MGDDRETVQALLARVEKVEHRLRVIVVAWIATTVGALLLVFTVQFAASQPSVLQARTVRTRALEIIDDSGKVRIALATLGPLAFVQMNDQADNARLGLQVERSAWIDIRNPGGKVAIRLTNGLEFPNPQPQVEIHRGGISLYDPNEVQRIELNSSLGFAFVGLNDETGQNGIGFSVLPHAYMTAGILLGPQGAATRSGFFAETLNGQSLFHAP